MSVELLMNFVLKKKISVSEINELLNTLKENGFEINAKDNADFNTTKFFERFKREGVAEFTIKKYFEKIVPRIDIFPDVNLNFHFRSKVLGRNIVIGENKFSVYSQLTIFSGLTNLVDYDGRSERKKTLLPICNQQIIELVAILGVAFGNSLYYAEVRDDIDPESTPFAEGRHLMIQTSEGIKSYQIPLLMWIAYYGKDIVSYFDREKLLAAPTWKTVELSNGILCVLGPGFMPHLYPDNKLEEFSRYMVGLLKDSENKHSKRQ